MYIAMNNFRVRPERAADFENAWADRESYLADVPGFREFHLLRGPIDEGGQRLYASHTVWEDGHGIAAGEAGIAEAGRPRLAIAHERIEALLVQIAEAVRADERADLLDRVRGCDQLLVRRRVDTVEARTGGRRRADAHVH